MSNVVVCKVNLSRNHQPHHHYHHYLSTHDFVAQRRKKRPDITEKLLTGASVVSKLRVKHCIDLSF